jgi:hypothetical protein
MEITLISDCYLSTGFTQEGDGTSLCPGSNLYKKVMQSKSMAPFKLKHNSETKHSEHRGKVKGKAIPVTGPGGP